MGKLARSWRLAATSWQILAGEKSLLVLPLLSALTLAAALAAIYFGIVEPLGLADFSDDTPDSPDDDPTLEAEHLLVMLLLYAAISFISTFFGVALASAALGRMRGEGGSAGTGLARASSRLIAIAGYAVMAGALAVALQVLRKRGGVAGRVGASFLDFASSVATFLVVPVIAAERCGPVAAVKRSALLLKTTWGENIIGSAGLGLVFFAAVVICGLLGGVSAVLIAEEGTRVAGITLAAITAGAFAVSVVFFMALDSVYRAALYRYAVDGAVPEGVSREALASAFRPREETRASVAA